MKQATNLVRDVSALAPKSFAQFVNTLVDSLYADFKTATPPLKIGAGVAAFLKEMHRTRFTEKLRDPKKQIDQKRLDYLIEHAVRLGITARNMANEKERKSIDMETIKAAIGDVEVEAREVVTRMARLHPNVKLAPFC